MKPFSYKEYKYKGIIFLYLFYFTFLETLNGKVVALQNGISKRQTQIKTNRERVTSIIESILFLGRQNIVLKGQRSW